MKLRAFLSFAMATQLVLGQLICVFLPAHAHTEPQNSDTAGASDQAQKNIQLDLSSTQESFSASAFAHHESLTITVGGEQVKVSSLNNLTPAEYLAALQVLASGTQSVTVDNSGVATGGTFGIPTSLAGNIGNLVIPAGVTGYYDFGAGNSSLNLAGNFVNNGSFYAGSSVSNVNSGVIAAQNIFNNATGLISSADPSVLASLGLLNNPFNLTLNAVQNIINQGTITSSGALNMTAGTSIINESVASAAVIANIAAQTNLNLTAQTVMNTGNITAAINNINIVTATLMNSGTIEAVCGNLSITNIINSTLNIQNLAGTLQANEMLSLGIANTTSNALVNVLGGALNAKQLYVSAATGNVALDVADIAPNVRVIAKDISLVISNGSHGLSLSGIESADAVGLSYKGAGNVSLPGFQSNGRDVAITTDGAIMINGALSTAAYPRSGNVVLNASGSIKTGDITAGGVLLASGANVQLKSGSHIQTGNIDVNGGLLLGDGGHILLDAGGNISTASLKASGGLLTGKAGSVELKANRSSSGSITVTGTIAADGPGRAGSISLIAIDKVKVTGTLSAVDGNILLVGSSVSTGAIKIGRGTVNINPAGSAPVLTIDLSQLAGSTGGSYILTGANNQPLTTDIVFTGTCSGCFDNVNSVLINTSGTFNSSGTNLIFNDDAQISISAAGGLISGNISGGQDISLNTNGQLQVQGNINLNDGNLALTAPDFSITGQINLGNGHLDINATDSTTLDASQLQNIQASSLTINLLQPQDDLTINGGGSFNGISDLISINVSGAVNATHSDLTLSPTANLDINAQIINIGSIIGGESITLTSGSSIDIARTLETSGAISLTAGSGAAANITLNDNAALSGATIEVTAVTGTLHVGADLLSTAGSITMSAGQSIDFSSTSSVHSATSVLINSTDGAIIGEVNLLADNGTIILLGAEGVDLGNGSFSQAYDNLEIISDRAGISLGGEHSSITGNLSLDAALDVNLLANSKLEAPGNIDILSQNAGIIANGSLLSHDAGITLSAEQAVVLSTTASVVAGQSIIISSASSTIDINAPLTSHEAGIEVRGNQAVTLAGGPLAALKDVTVTSSDATVDINSAITSHEAGIEVRGNQAVTLAGGPLAALKDVTIVSTSASVSVAAALTSQTSGVNVSGAQGVLIASSAPILAQKDINLTSGNAGIVVSSHLTSEQAGIFVNANQSITIDDTAVLSAVKAINIGSSDGGISSNGLLLSQDEGIELAAAQTVLLGLESSLSAKGAISIKSGNADVLVSGNASSSTGAISLVAHRNIELAPAVSLNSKTDVELIAQTGDLQSGAILKAESGLLKLNAANSLTLLDGSDLQAHTDIFLSTTSGDVTVNAAVSAQHGKIALSSGRAVDIQEGSLKAGTDIGINSFADIKLGSTGVLVMQADSTVDFVNLDLSKPLSLAGLGAGGEINIDSYNNGAGTGNITLGASAQIIAITGSRGGNSGTLTIKSGNNIISPGGAQLVALGGDMLLSAHGDINLQSGTKLSSLAVISQDRAKNADGTYNQLPVYSGGRLAIVAGMMQLDLNAKLDAMEASRQRANSISMIGASPFANTQLNVTGGSVVEVVFPSGSKSITNSTINVAGGILFLDPPGANEVNMTGVEITVGGPALPPPPPPPVSDSSGGGNPGSGSSIVIPGTTTGGGTPPPGTGLSIPPGSTGTSVINRDTVNIGVSLPSFNNSTNGNSSGNHPASARSSGTTTTPGSSTASENTSSQLSVPSLSRTNTNNDTTDKDGPSISRSMRPAIFCTNMQVLDQKESMDEDSWIVASSSCQPFTFEAQDGSIIVGTGPAKFAPAAGRVLLLKEGKLLIITVDKPNLVKTPAGNITVPVNTATIIEYDPRGVLRTANLAGGKTSIALSRNDETMILSAMPGEQVVIAEENVSHEHFELFSFPNVGHKTMDGWSVHISGLKGLKTVFDRNEMALHEPLLHCSIACLNDIQKRRVSQLIQSMTASKQASADNGLKTKAALPSKQRHSLRQSGESGTEEAAVIKNNSTKNKSNLAPVAFEEGDMFDELASSSLISLHAGSAVVKYITPAALTLKDGANLTIKNGEVMVSTVRPTVVKVGNCMVMMKSKTAALISFKNNMLQIRNLCESKSAGIRAVLSDRRCLGILAGQELIVGPKYMSLSQALGAEPVGRRRIKTVDLASGHSYINSEVSIISLMQNSQILQLLMKSRNDADKELSARILKMAVCLSMVTQSHGNYSVTGR